MNRAEIVTEALLELLGTSGDPVDFQGVRIHSAAMYADNTVKVLATAYGIKEDHIITNPPLLVESADGEVLLRGRKYTQNPVLATVQHIKNVMREETKR